MWTPQEWKNAKQQDTSLKFSEQGERIQLLDEMVEQYAQLLSGELKGSRLQSERAELLQALIVSANTLVPPQPIPEQLANLLKNKSVNAQTRKLLFEKFKVVDPSTSSVLMLADQARASLRGIEQAHARWAKLKTIMLGDVKCAQAFEKLQKLKLYKLSPDKTLTGRYVLEAWDDAHRSWGHHPAFNTWDASYKAKQGLYEWADEHEKSNGPIDRITYLSATQREAYRITFEGGLLCWKGQQMDTPSQIPGGSKKGWAAFVIAPDMSVYAGQHEANKFHHSSFLSGAPVIGAGEFSVVNGVLKGITERSGHYMPGPEHMLAVLTVLKAYNGVCLAGVQLEMFVRDEQGHLTLGVGNYKTSTCDADEFLSSGGKL